LRVGVSAETRREGDRQPRASGSALAGDRFVAGARARVVAQIAGCGAQATLPKTSHLHM
jgi:hypothetical protein